MIRLLHVLDRTCLLDLSQAVYFYGGSHDPELKQAVRATGRRRQGHFDSIENA